MKSKVYFTKEITPESVVRLYETLNVELKGNVCVKVHSGEPGNQNFLRPSFWKDIIEKVNGTVVECNTAYNGKRNTTKAHLETFKLHGWDHFIVNLMDAEGPDLKLEIPDGEVIKDCNVEEAFSDRELLDKACLIEPFVYKVKRILKINNENIRNIDSLKEVISRE